MLTIRTDQIRALREGIERRQRNETISDITLHLRQQVPEVMSRYTHEQHQQCIGEVLEAGGRLHIVDPEQLLNWSYIRFLTNVPFYEMEQFKDILNHPFLHPDAKGRHIVLAFFAIHRMHQGRSS